MQKLSILSWVVGSFLPSIVSMLSWVLRQFGKPLTLSGTSIYLEFSFAFILSVLGILLWKATWKQKMIAGGVTVVILFVQLVILGALAIRSSGLNGTQ